MANKKISELQVRDDVDTTCVLPVEDASQTWQVTAEQIKQFVLDGFVGSGGSLGINYIENPGAEDDVTGWTTYADGAATPVDLVGGVPTATWARSTSSPLFGEANFLFTEGTIGDGVAATITPSYGDIKRGAVLTGRFFFEPSANLTEGDYTVWIYDVANSALIKPNEGNLLQGGVTGQVYEQVFTFQPPTNGTTFRVAIHQVASNPANLKVDNISVGPDPVVRGTPVTNEKAFTSTTSLTGGTTTFTGSYRQIGNNAEVELDATFASIFTGGSAVFSLPFTIDTSKFGIPPVAGVTVLGTCLAVDTGSDTYPGVIVYQSSTSVLCRVMQDDAGVGSNHIVTASISTTVPFTWANGDKIIIPKFTVPVLGWSSSTQMSENMPRTVFSSLASSTTSLTDSTDIKVVFANVLRDLTGSLSSSKFTAPFADVFTFEGYALGPSVAYVTGDSYEIKLKIVDSSGTNFFRMSLDIVDANGTHRKGLAGARSFYLEAGATVELWVNQTGDTGAIPTGNDNAWFTISNSAGRSSIAASSKVRVDAAGNAGTVLTGDVTNIDFATEIEDSNGAWNGTVFTAPRPDFYDFDLGVNFSAAGTQYIKAYKNGSFYRGLTEINIVAFKKGSIRIKLNDGETVSFRSSAGATLANDTSLHFLTISSQGGI